MNGWLTHKGQAAGLPFESIDTDQLIPARFMSAPRNAGYGRFLLHDMRFDVDGTAQDFPLQPDTSVIVTRRNFGSGSSREAAVYALVDYGIRVVIAPSFGDIFAANAVNNGLLPARLPEEIIEQMLTNLAAGPASALVDIAAGRVELGQTIGHFDLTRAWRDKLINGWDDIDLTRQHADAIAKFANTYSTDTAWAWPRMAD